MIYFVQAGDGPVKIGYVQAGRSVLRRVAELQVGNHEQLHLLAVAEGGPALGRKLHRTFEVSRVRGEWFALTPLLARVIAAYQDNPAADFFGLEGRARIERRKLPGHRTLKRRAAKAAFDRALADGSMTIRFENAGEKG